MKRSKKIAVNVFRVILSLGFLWFAYSLIRFDDQIEVRHGTEIVKAQSVEERGESYIVTLSDTETRTLPKEGTTITNQPGFLTLFNQMNKTLFFFLIPFCLIPFLLLSLRWWVLLRATKFEVSIRESFLINYIGLFFNNFLPGNVGGDVARGLIVARGADRKTALIGTILLDRLIGLGAMILLATVCVLPFYRDPSMRLSLYIILGLFFGMIFSYLVYFNQTLRGLFQGKGEKGRIRQIFSDLDGAFLLVKEQKRVVVISLLLSLFGQSGMIILTYGLAVALEVKEASLIQFFVFEPIIFMITAVPISMGGWGIQEGAYAFFFGKAGVPVNGAVAISILFKLTLIFVSIPGGILLALGVGRRRNESGSDT